MKINYDVELNNAGMNANIIANILSDEKMKQLGFTDHVETRWYYCKNIGWDISFNITIDKNTKELEIDVLDEDFLQPYDYHKILSENEGNEIANKTHERVQHQMTKFMMAGVIKGYKMGDYI